MNIFILKKLVLLHILRSELYHQSPQTSRNNSKTVMDKNRRWLSRCTFMLLRACRQHVACCVKVMQYKLCWLKALKCYSFGLFSNISFDSWPVEHLLWFFTALGLSHYWYLFQLKIISVLSARSIWQAGRGTNENRFVTAMRLLLRPRILAWLLLWP